MAGWGRVAVFFNGGHARSREALGVASGAAVEFGVMLRGDTKFFQIVRRGLLFVNALIFGGRRRRG